MGEVDREDELLATLTAMQTQLAQQAALINELQAKQADGDGSLETALKEFAAQNSTPTTFTTTPCQHRYADGRQCGRYFDAHCAPDVGRRAEVGDHSFRLTPFEHEPKPKPRMYYAKDAVVVDVAPPESIEAMYLTEKQAAERLQMTVPAVRKLVKDGQLQADRIGTVVLLRKVGVERLAVLAEIALAEGITV